jgi:ParB family chromosome partitioning protein
MSTKVLIPDELRTPEVAIDLIDIEKDFNGREKADPVKRARLTRSIARSGVKEPLIVEIKEEGRYSLVAGEERLEAARAAGETSVPITVEQGNRHVTNAIENLLRSDLTPVEEARAVLKLRTELGLKTNKMVAEETGLEESWIAVRMRLLKLPEGAQKAIADGSVSLKAEPLLRKVAKVSPRVAEAACELAVAEQLSTKDLTERFGNVLRRIGSAGLENPPTMIPRHFKFSDVIEDRNERSDLARRFHAVRDSHFLGTKSDPEAHFSSEDIDAARGAGVLIEHLDGDEDSFRSHFEFVTDRAFAADRLVLRIEAAEKRAAKRKKGAEVNAAPPKKTDDGVAEEALAEEKKKAAKAAADQRDAARAFNGRLAHKLQTRELSTRKAAVLARRKAIAVQMLLTGVYVDPMRAVFPQLQGVKVAEDSKSGEEAFAYATSDEAWNYALDRIQRASTVEEVDGFCADLLLCAELADLDAFDKDQYPYAEHLCDEARKYLKDEIKAVRPRKSRALKS